MKQLQTPRENAVKHTTYEHISSNTTITSFLLCSYFIIIIFYNNQDAKATRKYCPASSSVASNTQTVHLKERASSQRIGAISKMFEYQTHEEYWTKPLDDKVKSVRL